MSEKNVVYIHANLEQEQNGQLFVKGNLDVLDVMDQINEDKEYFENKASQTRWMNK